MTSIRYEELYSRFFTKVEAYDLVALEKEQADEFLCNYLHSAFSKPYIRKLFSSLTFDNELSEINYEMRYVIDDDTDMEFVLELGAIGLVIAWVDPKIKSLTNINQMYGTSEEKFYSQSNHINELRNLKADSEKEQRRMIADRGYAWNTYLDGE